MAVSTPPPKIATPRWIVVVLNTCGYPLSVTENCNAELNASAATSDPVVPVTYSVLPSCTNASRILITIVSVSVAAVPEPARSLVMIVRPPEP